MKCQRLIVSCIMLLMVVACKEDEVETEKKVAVKVKVAPKKEIVEVEEKPCFPSLAGLSVSMDINHLLPILNAAIYGKVDGESFSVVKCEGLKLKFPPSKGAVYAVTLRDKYTLAEADKDGKVTLIRLPGVLVDQIYDCSGTPPEFVVEKVREACDVDKIPYCKNFKLLHKAGGTTRRQGDGITKKQGWGLEVSEQYHLRVSEDKDVLYEML